MQGGSLPLPGGPKFIAEPGNLFALNEYIVHPGLFPYVVLKVLDIPGKGGGVHQLIPPACICTYHITKPGLVEETASPVFCALVHSQRQAAIIH
jgi:hypothetical protein